MPKYYALTFLPWISLAIMGDVNERAAAPVGLAVALALLVWHRRAGQRWDSLILECSTAFYMAALSVVALVMPDAAVLDYGASLAIGWLALTAWGTLAARRPFTEGIARRQVSAEIAATDLFKRINTVLTLAWATGFTVTAAVLAAVQYLAPDNTTLLIACKIAGFALPALFTARYPDAARKRHFAEHGISESAYERMR
ncbi:hypothetical protein [Actinomadura hibisca]|uniref:hypothetical protein n=1 Tax=Actinomadura hibisca TaxID=68565 RepID=UPI0008364684|nr:hypothetical protein [Actinomadura hibisca]